MPSGGEIFRTRIRGIMGLPGCRVRSALQQLRCQPKAGRIGGVEQRSRDPAFALSEQSDPGLAVFFKPGPLEQHFIQKGAKKGSRMNQANPQDPTFRGGPDIGIGVPAIQVPNCDASGCDSQIEIGDRRSGIVGFGGSLRRRAGVDVHDDGILPVKGCSKISKVRMERAVIPNR